VERGAPWGEKEDIVVVRRFYPVNIVSNDHAEFNMLCGVVF